MNAEIWKVMKRWKALEAMAAETVPMDDESEPYPVFVFPEQVPSVLEIMPDIEAAEKWKIENPQLWADWYYIE